MVWGEVGKALIGPALGYATAMAKEWRDDVAALRHVTSLFFQVIVDGQGLVPEGGRRFEAANLVFTVTELGLTGLIDGPTYHIEVIWTQLSGSDPKRVRRFGYLPARRFVWLEWPHAGYALDAPSGLRPLIPTGHVGLGEQPRHSDHNWFTPLTTSDDYGLIKSIGVYQVFRHGNRRLQNVRAGRRMEEVLRQHCLDEHGQVRLGLPRPLSVDGLMLWWTPLESGDGGNVIHHYLVALNTALSADIPVRAVGFLYNSALRELRWLS